MKLKALINFRFKFHYIFCYTLLAIFFYINTKNKGSKIKTDQYVEIQHTQFFTSCFQTVQQLYQTGISCQYSVIQKENYNVLDLQCLEICLIERTVKSPEFDRFSRYLVCSRNFDIKIPVCLRRPKISFSIYCRLVWLGANFR